MYKMRNSLTITGLDEVQQNENCIKAVEQFMKEKMRMNIKENEIKHVYCVGQKLGKKIGPYGPELIWHFAI